MNTLTVWDVDDTLFKANQPIYIRDQNDNIIQTIDGKDYRKHMNGRSALLPEGHYYCFSELINGKNFYETKLPIEQPLNQLALDIERHKRESCYDVILMTARGEVDYLDHYKQAFRDHGVDVDSIEILFVGAKDTSDPRSKKSSSECKRIAYEQLLPHYHRVRIYEDDYRNLEMFYKVALDYHVDVELFHVNPEGNISRYYVK